MTTIKTSLVHLSFIFFAPLYLQAGGVTIGNGGDVIRCSASSENSLNGSYSLDYLLTLPNATGDDGLIPVSSWQQSLDRITKLLSERVPVLAASFKEFSKLIYNKSYTELRIWEPAPFGLVDLNDQRISSLIPVNCKTEGQNKISQAIIRQETSIDRGPMGLPHQIYKYVPTILSELEKNSPVQLSFLFVHEWLWDISNNVERNRRVNRFLHSKIIDSMPASEIVVNLKAMGLILEDLPDDGFDPAQWQGFPFKALEMRGKSLIPKTEVRIARRERIIDCKPNTRSCHPNWVQNARGQLYWPYRVTMASCFDDCFTEENGLKNYYPVILYFWDFQNLQSLVAKVRCRYVENPINNLSCELPSLLLLKKLLPEIEETTPYRDWPKFSAQLNEDSFRLSVRGYFRRKDFSQPGYSKFQTSLVETVWTSRFKLQDVLD